MAVMAGTSTVGGAYSFFSSGMGSLCRKPAWRVATVSPLWTGHEVRVPVVDRVVAHVRAGVRSLDELAAAEVERHVVDAARAAVAAPEQQVAGAGVEHRDGGALCELCHRVVREALAAPGPRLHGQPGAVEGERPGRGPLVGLAE